MAIRRRVLRWAVLLLGGLLMGMSGGVSVPAAAGGWGEAASPLAPGAPSERVRELLRSMTLEQKVGQILHVGFPGLEAGPEISELIGRHHVGGVILFSRNISDPVQVATLTNALQQMATRSGAGVPLLVSVDQEGGLVARLTRGATVFPGNMALGAAGSEELAYQAGLWTGRELRAVGIHQDYAPVVDVNNNPQNPVIGVRSFGESPEAVARLGVAMIRGLQDGGVLATAKHFPGHGDTTVDSHIDLPTVPHPMERLQQVELLPFQAAIDAGVASIMTAHITFPAVDPTPGLPATLSERVLTGLLRRQMGFAGLLVTDAMEMGAIANHFGVEEAAVRAVQAGADAVLVAWPKEWTTAVKVAHRLVEAARSGEISPDRLDEAAGRVLAAKERLGLLEQPMVDVSKVRERVGTREAHQQALEVARRSVTLVSDPQGFLPLAPGSRVAVVVPKAAGITGVENQGSHATGLGAALARAGLKVAEEVEYSLSPQLAELHRASAALERADAVVIGTYRAWESRYSGQADLVRAIWSARGGRPVVVLALREPYDLGRMPEGPALLSLYGTAPASLQAAAEALTGQLVPEGRLPVSIPGRWPAGYRWERSAR